MTTEQPENTAPNTPLMPQAQPEDERARRARPRLTISEAAEAVGVSRSTIRRKLDAGAFNQANKDNEGTWRIPVDSLIAAGFSLARPATSTPPAPPLMTQAQLKDERVHDYESQIVELRTQIEVERAHRTAAEQVAAAHLARAENSERALKMIEAAPALAPPPAPTARSSVWPWVLVLVLVVSALIVAAVWVGSQLSARGAEVSGTQGVTTVLPPSDSTTVTLPRAAVPETP